MSRITADTEAADAQFWAEHGYTAAEIQERQRATKRNKFLSRAFWAVAGVGGAVALVNTPVRFGQALDLGPWTDFVKHSDTMRYISDHVKGGGQAILYSQIANMTLSQVFREKAEEKTWKATGKRPVLDMKDHSLLAGASCIVGGFGWEKFTQAASILHKFDTQDMMWYYIGVAALVAWNKTAEKLADAKYPSAQKAKKPSALRQ